MASDRQVGRALVVLPRVVAERPDLADAVRAALDDCLADLVGRAAGDAALQVSLAAAVELIRPQAGAVAAIDHLPRLTAGTARLVGQVLLTAGPMLEAAALEREDVLPELARLHNTLNIAFGHWRERDWAVRAGRRSVELHRKLVDRDGAARYAGLASALSNLAVALSEVDDDDGAMAAGEEAVGWYRQLVEIDGDIGRRASLANALTNHSARLGRAARLDEALSSVQEAVELWRVVVAAGGPDALPGLARAVSNLSVRLGVLDRHHEALAASDEATDIRRRLAARGAEEQLADLAQSLNNRSARLSAVGRGPEALAVLEEAIRIRRRLVAVDADGHLEGLATSLHNLSFRLTAQASAIDERLAASSEAVTIRRELARSRPDTYRSALAAALHTESVDLADAGDTTGALQSAEEAVAIRRAIATDMADDDRSDEHRARLAGSLNNLSIAQAAIGMATSALDTATEAVGIRRELATRWPDTFRDDLADALGNLSSRLDEAGREADALAATQEALDLRRQLARENPDRHLGDLATSLNNFSVDLTRAGRLAEAVAAGEESVTIRRKLASARPDRYLRALALNLNNHAVSLADVDQHEVAAETLAEAVEIYQDLVATDPRGVLPELMMAAGNLAEQLTALDRRDDARQLFDAILSEHADTDWATGVVLLGRGWWQAGSGHLRPGIDDLCQAVELLHDDPSRQAAARTRLRRTRQIDPARFDAAWAGRGDLPVWLRHVDVTERVAEAVRSWIGAVDLDAAEAFLSAQADVLLTDEGQARMDHLVDANPGHTGLLLDRDIIYTARARGVAAAYVQHRERLWTDGVAGALDGWVGSPGPAELHATMAAEQVLLLSDEAARQMEAVLAADPADATLLVRAGLLALCRSDGIDVAFRLLTGDDERRRPPGLRALTAFVPRDLARARLRAGSEPDDPNAAFVHAVLAVIAENDPEADSAIARCARLVPSWRRRELATYLTGFTDERPSQADGLARLRALLADGGQPTE